MEIKDVENLALLAKIELSPEEQQSVLKDMEGILRYIKTIETVKVDDVETEHTLVNAWREDKAEGRDVDHDLIVGQFPESQDGFLKVRKIL